MDLSSFPLTTDGYIYSTLQPSEVIEEKGRQHP